MYVPTSRKRAGTQPTATQQVTDTHSVPDVIEAANGASASLELSHDGTGSKTATVTQLPYAFIPPRLIFLVISSLFWTCWLVTYTRYRYQSPAAAQQPTVPCNPSGRILAMCAHKGNAAELLSLKHSSVRDGLLSASNSVKYPFLDQMSALWQAGITCYDLDVVQLSGGDLIVGHPVDMVQLARSSSSSSNSKAAALVPGLLHDHSIQELRDAGVSADKAPLLKAVFQHFSKLKDESAKTRGASGTTSSSSKSISAAQAAAERKGWQQAPIIHIELKRPAAASLEAWKEVISLASTAGVADAVVLMLRQQAGSSSSRVSGERSALLQLAGSVRRSAKELVKPGVKSNETAAGGPLLGLIVPDTLLQQQVQQQEGQEQGGSNATATAPALLLQAAGIARSTEPAAANSTAAAVLEAFDVLAPSIKLPGALLAELVKLKPALAWTLETKQDVHKAMWAGLDLGSSSRPVQHQKQVSEDHAGLCSG